MFVVPLTPLEPLLGVEDLDLQRLIEGDPDERGDGDQESRTHLVDVVLPLLNKIPPREADCWVLYYVNGKRQQDIADIFQCTQAAVSYTILRACERLRFMLEIDKLSLTDAEILATLETTGLDRIDIAILMDFRHTSQQTLTAKNLKLTQGRVRHRLIIACRRLQEWALDRPELERVAKLFSALRDNPNILHRVDLPQWRGRGTQVVDDRWGLHAQK